MNGCIFKRRAAKVWQKPWLQSLEAPTQHKGRDQHKKALIGPASFTEMFPRFVSGQIFNKMAKVIGDAADAIALENCEVDLVVGGWKIVGLPLLPVASGEVSSFHVCTADAFG